MLCRRSSRFCRVAVACAVSGFLLWPSVTLAYESFQADVLCAYGSRGEFVCGDVMARGDFARMDVTLNKVGEFSLLVDVESRKMRILSRKLKAYVEIFLDSTADNWRELLMSAASAVMPQSLGLVSLYEKDSQDLGKVRWQGVSVKRSRHDFEATFMGKSRRFTIETWEADKYQPFPVKAMLIGKGGDASGSARLAKVRNTGPRKEVFSLPEGYVRYTSIMDLLLYALTAL